MNLVVDCELFLLNKSRRDTFVNIKFSSDRQTIRLRNVHVSVVAVVVLIISFVRIRKTFLRFVLMLLHVLVSSNINVKDRIYNCFMIDFWIVYSNSVNVFMPRLNFTCSTLRIVADQQNKILDVLPPPFQSNFLHFHAVFGTFWANNRLAGSAWEIMDPPL